MPTSINPDATSAQYQWALRFLDKRVDFERFQTMPGPEREIKLDRMRALLDRLGNPQDKLPIIHVAGTKGKGSTSAMIASVLCAAGYRTGLFTSPHLERVEERIAIDGQPCTADQFAALVAAVQPAVETLDREATAAAPRDHGPTYFEIITAMALLHFVRSGVQVAVLEVGLGGRLDSTNVCRPLVSVITSISYDHVQQLGDTLQSIAREKAGIIKPGVPVISDVTAEEPRSAIRQIAKDCGCSLVELKQDFDFEYHPPQHLEKQPALGSMDFWLTNVKSPLPLGEGQGEGGCSNECHNLPLALLGRHQAANAAVALATIHELIRQAWNISEQAIRQGLAAVRWPARIEIVARQPVVILDSAHNSASIAALMEVLKESFSVTRRLLLFATTRDKDYSEMLKLLLDGFDEIVFTQYTTNPRALPPAELEATAFQHIGRHFPIFPTPAEAWTHLRQSAVSEDLICITGSFFLAGEMRKLL
ncbi:MAG: folylpolyglutamate synthase/dihydrofolate synthase family protein [Thermoguttaceae bacterium]|jgi:dihydrofolate synthase/folylpolyglutamate synthase